MKRSPSFLFAATALGGALLGTPAAAAPHDHGGAQLNVALDGKQLVIELEMPLDSALGYERAPRTAAEKQTAAKALATLRQAEGLFTPDAAAQCQLKQVEVNAPLLEGQAAAGGSGHADLDARYTYECAQAAQLRSLAVGLFTPFTRLQRVAVQLVGSKAPAQQKLTRAANRVRLAP